MLMLLERKLAGHLNPKTYYSPLLQPTLRPSLQAQDLVSCVCCFTAAADDDNCLYGPRGLWATSQGLCARHHQSLPVNGPLHQSEVVPKVPSEARLSVWRGGAFVGKTKAR